MANYFPPNSNAFAKWLIWGGLVFMTLFVGALTYFARVSNNMVGVPIAQPIDYSHALHTSQLGLDCRYCHSSVEVSNTPNIPPTKTCMTCHSQIRVDSPQLQPLFDSWGNNGDGLPLEWKRVHDMPDFVYFDHSAHVNKGVGCSTCHGEINKMEGIWKNEPMSMGWCLECHRNPDKFVRPKSEVFNMSYEMPTNQHELGSELVEAYNINEERLPQCSTCHR